MAKTRLIELQGDKVKNIPLTESQSSKKKNKVDHNKVPLSNNRRSLRSSTKDLLESELSLAKPASQPNECNPDNVQVEMFPENKILDVAAVKKTEDLDEIQAAQTDEHNVENSRDIKRARKSLGESSSSASDTKLKDGCDRDKDGILPDNLTSTSDEIITESPVNPLIVETAPLINLEELATKKDLINLQNLVEARFRSQAIQFTQQKCTLTSIQNILVKNNPNKDLMTSEMFGEKYDIRLPYKKMTKFLIFDESLKANEDQAKDLNILFNNSANISVPLKIYLKDILQIFCKRKVLINFVAQRSSGVGKIVFNETKFCELLKAVVNSIYQTPAREFLQLIGKILANENDWEGHRYKRLNKSKENNVPQTSQQENEPQLELAD